MCTVLYDQDGLMTGRICDRDNDGFPIADDAEPTSEYPDPNAWLNDDYTTRYYKAMGQTTATVLRSPDPTPLELDAMPARRSRKTRKGTR